VRTKRASIVLLILMLSRYALFPVIVLLGVGMRGRVF
jgi:hypothetical protein